MKTGLNGVKILEKLLVATHFFPPQNGGEMLQGQIYYH
jgi:hypothetical protein